MIHRAVALLALLAGLAFYLDREQRAGRFQRADEVYLDFLLGNARERFDPARQAITDQVVFVRLREEEREEYSAWPPLPADWRMIVTSLAAYEPDVLVIPTPLRWGEPLPEFLGQLHEALLPFPSVVLGAEAASAGEAAPESVALLREILPRINRMDGDPGQLRAAGDAQAVPIAEVRRQMEIGLVIADVAAAGVPLAVRMGGEVMPSLVLQALSRHSRAPYLQQRLRLGAGAGAHIGGGLYVPLSPGGELQIAAATAVPSVNALDLMTGSLADALSAGDKAKLGRGKIIVIGLDRDGAPSLASTQARALAQALSFPRLRVLERREQWLVCGAAAFLALSLLWCRRSRAVRAGLVLIFLAFVVTFLLFQASLIWCPPALPAAIIAAGAVFSRLFGREARAAETAASPV
jgi:hypothetical protein